MHIQSSIKPKAGTHEHHGNHAYLLRKIRLHVAVFQFFRPHTAIDFLVHVRNPFWIQVWLKQISIRSPACKKPWACKTFLWHNGTFLHGEKK